MYFCRINSDDHQMVYFLIMVILRGKIFMNEKNEFKNLEMEIKRSKCLCGCYNTYHYLCALNNEYCYFDNELIRTICNLLSITLFSKFFKR